VLRALDAEEVRSRACGVEWTGLLAVWFMWLAADLVFGVGEARAIDSYARLRQGVLVYLRVLRPAAAFTFGWLFGVREVGEARAIGGTARTTP
jgi:hypothetical protein